MITGDALPRRFEKSKKCIKLGVFQSHPIQYFAPLWRLLDKDPTIDLTVFYLSDCSIRGNYDVDFGQTIAWDIPLLEGYKSVFLKKDAQPDRWFSMRIGSVKSVLKEYGLECVLIPGYSRPFEWQVLWAAKRLKIKVIMRGDFSESPSNNPIWNTLRSFVLRRLYKTVDAFSVFGIRARQHLIKHGVDTHIMFNSPYCVDDSLFKKHSSKKIVTLRKSLGILPKDKVVMFSGKIDTSKTPSDDC